MEDNLTKNISNQENNVVSKNVEDADNLGEIKNPEEEIKNPEEILEKIEPILEEVDKISDEIEQKSESLLETTDNPSLIKKNQNILEELYQKSENFLLQVSKQLAGYSKEVSQSFRDKYIKNKSKSIRKNFYESKSIDRYRESKSKNLPDEENKKLENLKKKALRSFDSEYKSSLSLLQTIESNNWGNSKNKTDAIDEVNSLLLEITRKAVLLGKDDELFNIIKIYENNLPLNSKGENNVFSSIISEAYYFFSEKIKLDESSTVSTVLKNDPYLILNYINNRTNSDLYENSKYIEEQIDKIIDKYPENSCSNVFANKLFDKTLKLNPEKYGSDLKNRKFIFESFKTDYVKNGKSKFLEENKCFFNKELNDLPNQDINELIESTDGYNINKDDTQLLLASTDLKEDNFEKLFYKIEKYSYSTEKETYSKEAFLKCLEKETKLQFIPFLKYKEFDLDPETRVSMLENIIKNGYSSTLFTFLNKIFSNFKEIFEGIPEEKYRVLIQELIEKSISGRIEQVRTIHAFLPEYDIPLEYKEQINTVFSKNYSGNDIGKIFTEEKESFGLSAHEEWLKGKSEITPSLEKNFYEKGNMNEFRHFFFEVIEVFCIFKFLFCMAS